MVADGNAPRVDKILGGPGISKADAQLVNDLLVSIRNDNGQLSTEDLLDEMIKRSRPKVSPTHHLFEWDQTKGHAIYLLERARRLFVAVRVVFAEAPEAKPVRAFPVVVMAGNKGPAPMREVMSSKEQSQALLEQALADLERLRVRYEHLVELRDVFLAVGEALKSRPTKKR